MSVQIPRSRAGRHSLSLGHFAKARQIRRTTSIDGVLERLSHQRDIASRGNGRVHAITASAPISIASQAWLGRPIPASMMTGTCALAVMISMKSRMRRPILEPINEPSGITAAAPASSS